MSGVLPVPLEEPLAPIAAAPVDPNGVGGGPLGYPVAVVPHGEPEPLGYPEAIYEPESPEGFDAVAPEIVYA